MYVELNHIKTRSEREIEQLKEHLRLAMAALQEKEAVRNSLAERVGTFGKYGTQGDKVELSGVYHRACPAHAGELEIHAVSLEVKVEGCPVYHEVSPELGIAGIVMLGMAAVVLLVERLLRGRSRLRFMGLRL